MVSADDYPVDPILGPEAYTYRSFLGPNDPPGTLYGMVLAMMPTDIYSMHVGGTIPPETEETFRTSYPIQYQSSYGTFPRPGANAGGNAAGVSFSGNSAYEADVLRVGSTTYGIVAQDGTVKISVNGSQVYSAPYSDFSPVGKLHPLVIAIGSFILLGPLRSAILWAYPFDQALPATLPHWPLGMALDLHWWWHYEYCSLRLISKATHWTISLVSTPTCGCRFCLRPRPTHHRG